MDAIWLAVCLLLAGALCCVSVALRLRAVERGPGEPPAGVAGQGGRG